MRRGSVAFLACAVWLAALGSAGAERGKMSRGQAEEARNITGFMKMLVGRHVTPAFAVVPHANNAHTATTVANPRSAIPPSYCRFAIAVLT